MKTLTELTNKECGLVVYDNDVFAINWGNYGDYCTPRILMGNIIAFPGEEWELIESYHSENIREVLPGVIRYVTEEEAEVWNLPHDALVSDSMNILADPDGYIPTLFHKDAKEIGGMVYVLHQGDDEFTVVAPDE